MIKKLLLLLTIPIVSFFVFLLFSDSIINHFFKNNDNLLTNSSNKSIISNSKSLYLLNNMKNYEQINEDRILFSKDISGKLSYAYFSKNSTVVDKNNDNKTLPLPELITNVDIQKDHLANTNINQKIDIQMIVPESDVAIINDHIFNVGDEFNGIKLISIKRNTVCYILQKGKTQCTKL